MKKMLKLFFYPFVDRRRNLEQKWWHRMFKVYYVAGVVFFFFYFMRDASNELARLLPDYPGRYAQIQVEILIFTYLFYLSLQFLYFKILLYIVYGNE